MLVSARVVTLGCRTIAFAFVGLRLFGVQGSLQVRALTERVAGRRGGKEHAAYRPRRLASYAIRRKQPIRDVLPQRGWRHRRLWLGDDHPDPLFRNQSAGGV